MSVQWQPFYISLSVSTENSKASGINNQVYMGGRISSCHFSTIIWVHLLRPHRNWLIRTTSIVSNKSWNINLIKNLYILIDFITIKIYRLMWQNKNLTDKYNFYMVAARLKITLMIACYYHIVHYHHNEKVTFCYFHYYKLVLHSLPYKLPMVVNVLWVGLSSELPHKGAPLSVPDRPALWCSWNRLALTVPLPWQGTH